MEYNPLLLALQRLEKNDLSGYTTVQRRDVLGIVAGVLVGMRLDLPNTPVNEIVNFYVSKNEPIAMRMFEQTNAQLFINTMKAAEVARNIFMFRYRMVYDDSLVLKLLPVIFAGSAAALPDGVINELGKVGVEVYEKAASYYF